MKNIQDLLLKIRVGPVRIKSQPEIDPTLYILTQSSQKLTRNKKVSFNPFWPKPWVVGHVWVKWYYLTWSKKTQIPIAIIFRSWQPGLYFSEPRLTRFFIIFLYENFSDIQHVNTILKSLEIYFGLTNYCEIFSKFYFSISFIEF